METMMKGGMRIMISVDRLCGHPAVAQLRGYATTKNGQKTLHIVTESVREIGLLTRLIVTPDPDSDMFFVIDGHTRLEAARRLGISAVWCDMVEVSPAEALAAYGALNTIRHNFTVGQRVMFYFEAHRDQVLAAAKAEGTK